MLLLEVSICTHNVGDSDLEKKVVKIFEKVCYSFEGNNIKACNWKSQKKWKGNSEVFPPKRLPKYTEHQEKVLKVVHETNWFIRRQACKVYVHVVWYGQRW